MASRKSKGPNGERGGRLMKAMMCEANRKEDRMCGKQMERRQPWGRAQSAALAAQWLCLKSPETPGIVGMSVPCLRASHSTRKGTNFAAGCCPGCLTAAPCSGFGEEPENLLSSSQQGWVGTQTLDIRGSHLRACPSALKSAAPLILTTLIS